MPSHGVEYSHSEMSNSTNRWIARARSPSEGDCHGKTAVQEDWIFSISPAMDFLAAANAP
jgi:hypothetical protein